MESIARRVAIFVDSVRVIVIPKFNYSLSPKVTDLCLHDTVQINLATQMTDTPYVYKWIDPIGIGSLYNPATNKKATNIRSPKIIATSFWYLCGGND
jgi:hypothetical protein